MSGPEIWSNWGVYGTSGTAFSASLTIGTSAGSLVANCQSTVVGGTAPYGFDWDYGDNSAHGNVEDPGNHAYSTWGQYHIKLTVTDAAGGSIVVEQDIVLVPTSEIGVSTTVPSSGTAGVSVNFACSASGGDGSYTYKWDFGDGATSTSEDPAHTYAAAGSYSWMLTVTDGAGKKGYAYGSINVGTSSANTTLAPSRISQDVQDPDLPAMSLWYLNGTSGTAVPTNPTTTDNTNCQAEDANYAGNPGGITKSALGFWAQKLGGAWATFTAVRGIKIRLKMSAEAADKVYVASVGLVNSSGILEPLSTRAVKVFVPVSAGWIEFGHEEDKWGLPSSWFTEAQLESTDFGVWFQTYCKATASARWVKVDKVEVVVYH